MIFTCDLLEVDKPVFGGNVFPADVVRRAIIDLPRSAYHGILELCRYEHWPDPLQPPFDEYGSDTMTAKLAASGRMLEVVGSVQDLQIVNGVLRASAEIQNHLVWHLPLDGHTAVPYVDILAASSSPKIRVVKSFLFTEVVLVYQAVTKLALRKYAERRKYAGRKSLKSVDTTR